MNSASQKTNGWGSKLKKAAGVAAKGIAVASTAVTAVAGAAAAATTKVAQYGDNIDKMSQKLGMSAEAYQEWDFILQHSGASIDSMQASMKTLSNAAVDGKDAFEKLGISIEDAQAMSQEDLFGVVIEKLQGMEEGSERTAIASDLLGRSATELGALLNTSAEDTEAMRQKVHDLGGVMSNESVKAAAKFQDSLQNLKTGISGLTNGVVREFLPSITTVMDGLTALVSGDSSGMMKIEQGISDFTAKLPEIVNRVLPALTTVASSLVTGLVSSLSTMLPTIVKSGGQVLMSLLQGILDNAPKIVDGVMAAIDAFIDFVTDNLPKIVEMGFEILAKLAVGIIKAIPDLLKKVPQIISAIIGGLRSGLSGILQVGKDVISTIWNGIKSGVSQAWTWGTDLISNFVAGIKSKISSVVDAVSGVAGKVWDFLHFSEPEEGPLSDFHTYAPDMMKSFADGIKKNENLVADQVAKSFDFGAQIKATPNVSYVNATARTKTDYLLEQILAQLSDMEIPDSFKINGREFGRLVKGAV